MAIPPIASIRAALSAGVARQNKYTALVISPFNNIFGFLGTAKLSCLCRETEIPGKAVATAERVTHGPVRKMPYQTIYNDITLNFICGELMLERRFFDYWQQNIIDFESHYVHYADDYLGTIVLVNFSEMGVPNFAISLREAYPLSVAPQVVSYDANDSFQTLSVTFAYHRWTNDVQTFLPEGGSGVPNPLGERGLDDIISGANTPVQINPDIPINVSPSLDDLPDLL